MAKKRGESGLCLVLAVDKPSGMSSHDVVNRCRRIFGERRVGHTGTLDPLASGVLPICVGPATRLDAYMTGHDKHYVVDISFGTSTDTDDAAGEVLRSAPVPSRLFDLDFASSFVAGLVGPQRQMPPVYSAIKVGGQKACDAARKGTLIKLEPRDIEVYSAELLAVEGEPGDDRVIWRVAFHVSKGTYIRSLARDAGVALGCPAHMAALRRTRAGALTLEDCVSLEALEEVGLACALDPISVLGYRFAFLDDASYKAVACGNALRAQAIRLCERNKPDLARFLCACTSGVRESCEAPAHGELVSLIHDNKLVSIYEYDGKAHLFKCRCNFQIGVIRGAGI